LSNILTDYPFIKYALIHQSSRQTLQNSIHNIMIA